MPIKGLTDRGLSFPQIGNIRKGDKSGRNGAPKDLTYFKVEFDEKEVARSEKFLKCYGSQPSEINILLPFNEIERVWDAWCEGYTAGRMVARSDGEYFSYLADLATGKMLVQNGLDANGQRVPHKDVLGTAGKTVIKCRPVGRLKIIIPELQSLAYLVVHTTSVIDIRNISEQLSAIQQINNGRIAGIPLVLRRRPKKISVPRDGGERARMTKYMLSIEVDPAWAQAKFEEMHHYALPGAAPALPAGQVTQEAEYEEVEQAELVENENYEQSTEEPWTDEIIEAETVEDEQPEEQPAEEAKLADASAWESMLVEIASEKNTTVDKLNKALQFGVFNHMESKQVVTTWLDAYADARKASNTPQESAVIADETTQKAIDLGAIS